MSALPAAIEVTATERRRPASADRTERQQFQVGLNLEAT